MGKRHGGRKGQILREHKQKGNANNKPRGEKKTEKTKMEGKWRKKTENKIDPEARRRVQ